MICGGGGRRGGNGTLLLLCNLIKLFSVVCV